MAPTTFQPAPAIGEDSEETDVLVVGSGAPGLTAALRAQSHGLRVVLIEKTSKIGGSSAASGGMMWLPGNPVAEANGFRDDKDQVLRYMDAAIGDDAGPPSSPERRHAFLDNAPRMVAFLQSAGFRFRFMRDSPEYHPELPGALGGAGRGRSIETEIFDMKKLGPWRRHVMDQFYPVPPVYSSDAAQLAQPMVSLTTFLWILSKIIPVLLRALIGQDAVTMGRGLVARLLWLNLQRECDIRRETPLLDLVVDDEGTVIGAKVQSEGQIRTIYAKRGVLLCAGGFAHNSEMRQKYMPKPASTEWSPVPRGDTGDAIIAGIKLGAQTAQFDDATWVPMLSDPLTGKPHFTLERFRPFSIIVDASGKRFMNEAGPYVDSGQRMYARNREVKAIPAWMIFDWSFRKRYMLGSLLPRLEPTKALTEGRMFKASTLGDLAEQIGVDRAGLQETVERYNAMCETGVDTDFGKGGNVHDRHAGDPNVKPNPNMGPIEVAPFFATQVWPGDIGTKGGLLTDEYSRVLHKDGRPIKGLYACGNTSASIMGRSYLAGGCTLGPHMTFAFIAADHMARTKE